MTTESEAAIEILERERNEAKGRLLILEEMNRTQTEAITSALSVRDEARAAVSLWAATLRLAMAGAHRAATGVYDGMPGQRPADRAGSVLYEFETRFVDAGLLTAADAAFLRAQARAKAGESMSAVALGLLGDTLAASSLLHQCPACGEVHRRRGTAKIVRGQEQGPCGGGCRDGTGTARCLRCRLLICPACSEDACVDVRGHRFEDGEEPVEEPMPESAHRWFKNGDHPEDGDPSREGKVVRYFRHPQIPGNSACVDCGRLMHDHGWIDCGGDGVTVCPGNMVVRADNGAWSARRHEPEVCVHLTSLGKSCLDCGGMAHTHEPRAR